MRYDDTAIPLGSTWSSPFARWQGKLAEVSSLDLAVATRTASPPGAERRPGPQQAADLALVRRPARI